MYKLTCILVFIGCIYYTNANYVLHETTILEDYGYFGIGKTHESFNDTYSFSVKTTFDVLLSSLYDKTYRDRVYEAYPVYIVGDRVNQHHEFDDFTDVKTMDGRNLYTEVDAFADMSPYPGFISRGMISCHGNTDEDIIAHEMLHTIHMHSLGKEVTENIADLYNMYNVTNNVYDNTSYAFETEYEFFSEMSQIFFGISSRADVTGGITRKKMKKHLPKMYWLLKRIFIDRPSVKAVSCGLCPNKSYC
jgi:hypothetical protein